MSVATILYKKLLGFLFIFINPFKNAFKRAMCFLNRTGGRRNSGSLLPVTTPHLDIVSDIQQTVPSNDMEIETWDNWGIEDQNNSATNSYTNNSSANHINNNYGGHHGRPRHNSQTLEEEEVPEPDFFQDMTPQFRKPAKIVIKKKEENYMATGLSSRLAMTSEVPIHNGNELGTWDDSTNTWGDEVTEDLSWEADEAIRGRKKIEREQRQIEQQKKKREREMRMGRKDGQFSAVRLS